MTHVRVLFAGGGTGGHLFSGVAVAQALLVASPESDVAFVGSERGIEHKVIPQLGWPLRTLPISGIKGKRIVGAVRAAAAALAAVWKSFALLRELQPSVVIGIGGYASGPTVLAASLAGYPTAIIEQNVIPGFTNKVLSWFVRRVYTPHPAAGLHFAPRTRHKIRVTGNPIRSEILKAMDERPSSKRDSTHAFRLLVFGGSQGARSINSALKDAAPLLAKGPAVEIWHQVGASDVADLQGVYASSHLPAKVVPFIQNMGEAYAWADLVVCRAGASTLAELTAIGKPAILIPYPHAIYNHQEHNAAALVASGAALMVRDSDLTGAKIVEAIERVRDRATRDRMHQASRALGHPEAAATIAGELIAWGTRAPNVERQELAQ